MRALDGIAAHCHRALGITDGWGRMRTGLVDIDRLAEYRGLRVVGSSRSLGLGLPPRTLAMLDIRRRIVVVSNRLFDDPSREDVYRQVIAHEVAHDMHHSNVGAQPRLPFGEALFRKLDGGQFAYSRERIRLENEANVLGALLLIPADEMAITIGANVAAYFSDDWTRYSSWCPDVELKAAHSYSDASVTAICERFLVPTASARLALDYWRILDRPNPRWLPASRARIAPPA